MLFSSVSFLFVFLPLVCFFYFLSPKSLKNYILLIASIIFYAWGEPRYLSIMLVNIIINYWGAIFVDKYRKAGNERKCKLSLILSIIADLSFLYYFKYFNFTIENINALFHTHIDFVKVVMPIGISFYTFQAMSYLIDVYREEVEVQRDVYKLALYITLFPQLVAGPIVKYHDVADQIDNRVVRFDNVVYGVKRFIIGLAKKVLIANTMGAIADKIYEQPLSQLDFCTTWLGAISYAFQIFYDFSGYSDMAIGLGSIFGFKFLENFNYPFISKSVSEYWRRWHISLSTWFRDYLFYPISKKVFASNFAKKLIKRIKRKKANLVLSAISLFITWALVGWWHGAEWNFLIYGLYNGLFLYFETLTKWSEDGKTKKVRFIQHFYTLVVAVVGLVFFRSVDIAYAWDYIKIMFSGHSHANPIYTIAYYIDNIEIITFVVAILCSMPIFQKILSISSEKRVLCFVINLWLLALFVLSCASIAASTYNPFIYFRF